MAISDFVAFSMRSSSNIIVYAVKQMQMYPSILLRSLW